MDKEEKVVENLIVNKPDFINTNYEEYIKWKRNKSKTNNSNT